MANKFLYSLRSCVGGAPYDKDTKLIVRLVLKGCANRPFFHISVQDFNGEVNGPVIEQLGVYDPLPNEHNEKVVGVNFNRLQHWVKEGAVVSQPCKKLLGLAGYMPIHPKTYREAWNRRKLIMETLEKLKAQEKENSQAA